MEDLFTIEGIEVHFDPQTNELLVKVERIQLQVQLDPTNADEHLKRIAQIAEKVLTN